VLTLQVLHTLLTHNDALGWFEYFVFDHLRCLPTLHTLQFVCEIGSLRPHTMDMLKVVLQAHNHILLLRSPLLLYTLHALLVLRVS